jgi:hypothetical protein
MELRLAASGKSWVRNVFPGIRCLWCETGDYSPSEGVRKSQHCCFRHRGGELQSRLAIRFLQQSMDKDRAKPTRLKSRVPSCLPDRFAEVHLHGESFKRAEPVHIPLQFGKYLNVAYYAAVFLPQFPDGSPV